MYHSLHKKVQRLKGYDYGQDGLYFVTICTDNFILYFGHIKNKKMHLSPYGKVIEDEWIRTAFIRKNVKLYEYQVMPNHLHAIIEIHDLSLPNTELFSPNKISPFFKHRFGGRISKNLFAIMRGFKGAAKTKINSMQNDFVFEWQNSFQDHIIRDEMEYERIVRHIKANPANWPNDPNNPESPTFRNFPSVY